MSSRIIDNESFNCVTLEFNTKHNLIISKNYESATVILISRIHIIKAL